MRTSTLLGFCVISALSSSLTGCDEVAKAVDANNSQPGEADGRAVELASMPQRIASLASDATEIWIVAENGDVLKRPRSDANVPPTLVGNFGKPISYEKVRAALDASFLYIHDGGALLRVPRAGGPAEKLTSSAASGLAQSADALFVVSLDKKTLLAIDKKTKAVTDLAAGFASIEDVIADGDRLVVADRDLETISAIAMKGGAKTELAKNQSRPYRVGFGPDHVYWINGALSDANKAVEDRVLRVKKDGSGQPEVVVQDVDGFPKEIAADAQFLYLDNRCGGLYRVPVAGGEPKKFLDAAVQDFDASESGILVVEDNSCRFDDAARNKPNRLLSVTK